MFSYLFIILFYFLMFTLQIPVLCFSFSTLSDPCASVGIGTIGEEEPEEEQQDDPDEAANDSSQDD